MVARTLEAPAPDVLMRRIQTEPGDDAAWSDLFRLLALGGAPGPAIELAVSRHQIRRDAAVFTYHRVAELADAGEHGALEALYQASDETGAFRGLFAYGLTLCAARAFRLELTVAFLREAAYVNAQAARDLFAHEGEFCGTILGQICQQASLLEDGDYAPAFAAPPALDLPTPAQSGLLVLASCCDTYFQAYGERFVSQLADALPDAAYLIHVVGPTAEGDALRERLRARFPQGTFSIEPDRADPAVLASRRFMIAPAVYAGRDGDLLIMDIDSVFKADFGRIIAASQGQGPAYFGNPDQLAPSLVVSAAYIYLPSGNPIAETFLAHVASYLQRKLAEPTVLWTVDQMALFRALCLLSDEERGRTVDLARQIRDGVRAIVADGHEIPEEVRLSRRVGHDSFAIAFDENRRPILTAS